MIRRAGIAIALGILVLVGAAAPAPALATLTFGELPFQPVDGLSFMGVTFGFTVGGVGSPDAHYHGGGPGSITFVQDPSLEGNAAGILTLDFAGPVKHLQFGVALSIAGPLTPGFTVELFDAALMSLGVTPVNTASLISFTEAQFTYPGGPPVRRAVLDFEDRAGRFAFDNLTFVPEPASLVLLGVGLAGLVGFSRRRK